MDYIKVKISKIPGKVIEVFLDNEFRTIEDAVRIAELDLTYDEDVYIKNEDGKFQVDFDHELDDGDEITIQELNENHVCNNIYEANDIDTLIDVLKKIQTDVTHYEDMKILVSGFYTNKIKIICSENHINIFGVNNE